MKIIQITFEEAMNSLTDARLHRIMICNDANYGGKKKHYSARIRPVKSIPMGDLLDSKDDPNYAFVLLDGPDFEYTPSRPSTKKLF